MTHSRILPSRTTLTAIALAAIMSFAVQSTLAEDQKPRHHQSQRLDYIFNQLDITEEQRSDVQDILRNAALEHRDAMRERRANRDERPSREEWQAKREERQAMREEKRTALKDQLGTVLSPEQVEGLVTYLDAHRPMKRRGHHHTKSQP